MSRIGLAAGLLLLACAAVAGCGRAPAGQVTLRLWGLGREGEVVKELAADFERENPGIKVDVQQIPWSAAHEKLLTAHVGHSTPDLAQLGNTWIAEFAALQALEPLDTLIATATDARRDLFFGGIWDTNVLDGTTYGIPWYVDTRVLFYRKDLLARAGYTKMPEDWAGWRAAMVAVRKSLGGGKRTAIFLPANEWTQPVVLGMQAGSPLLKDHDTRGAFSEPEFRRAFDFYLSIFRAGLAPALGNQEMSNLYQEFARGSFAMYITGPWNLGEFRSRLPDSLQSAWATAPLPGPDGAASGVSTAGGSSLVIFRNSRHKAEAFRLVEFLSRPTSQARFFHLTGDLPARREAWQDSALVADPNAQAFRIQLERVRPTPLVPEWEAIATRLQEKAEAAIRGVLPADSALAQLDRDVNTMLEKRRWILARSAR